ncbi:MAG: glycosyltransferase [Candidatus Micrarchaeia archaeon]
MQIAFYSDTYLPAVDGVVTSMLDFKKELESRGHKVYIFAPGTFLAKKKYESKDVFIYTGIKFKPYPQYSAALFPYHSILKLSSLNIDLIHAQTPFAMGFNGMLAAKLGRYPIVGSFHTLVNDKTLAVYYPKNMRRFYQKYLWKYVKFFYRHCNTTIAPSNAIANRLKRYHIENIQVVPNGVDLNKFNPKADPSPAQEAFGLRRNKKIILYLGRISKEKNLDTFIKAAAYLGKKREDIEFVVGGTGPFLDAYSKKAKKYGLANKIKFLGFVSNDLLPSIYAAADVFCMPSKFETQGIVCLEAMAEGTPVVAANTPVLNEFVKSGYNGEHFDASNYLDCARKIEKVLNNSEAYKKGAVNTAKAFSLKKVTDKLIKVYKNTIDRAIY